MRGIGLLQSFRVIVIDTGHMQESVSICLSGRELSRILRRALSECLRCLEHTAGRIVDFKEAVDEASEENITRNWIQRDFPFVV